jgi:hypothetical protein
MGRRASGSQAPPTPRPRRQASTTSASEAEQGRDLVQAQRLLALRVHAPGGGTFERGLRFRHLGQQRRHLRALRGRVLGLRQRLARGVDAQRAQRQFGGASAATAASDAAAGRAHRAGQRGRCLVEPPEQQQPARRDQPRLQRVGVVGVRLQRGRRGASARGVPPRSRMASATSASATTQRARASSSCAPKPRAGAPQQLARAQVLAQLRHRDAAQRQRRRVVAQRHPLERAERVAGAQRAGGRGDQGIHGPAMAPTMSTDR